MVISGKKLSILDKIFQILNFSGDSDKEDEPEEDVDDNEVPEDKPEEDGDDGGPPEDEPEEDGDDEGPSEEEQDDTAIGKLNVILCKNIISKIQKKRMGVLEDPLKKKQKKMEMMEEFLKERMHLIYHMVN